MEETVTYCCSINVINNRQMTAISFMAFTDFLIIWFLVIKQITASKYAARIGLFTDTC